MTYWATAWTLGSEAALGLPLGCALRARDPGAVGLAGSRPRESLASVEPSIARDGRVVFLVDGGSEALVGAALGGVEAGFRLLSARLGDGDDEAVGSVELLPPGAVPPPMSRTRANVVAQPDAGWSRRSGDRPERRPVQPGRAGRSPAVLRRPTSAGRSSTSRSIA